jgi:hypothetical protein
VASGLRPGPSPADFGFNVTLAMACITVPDDVIVTVSDRKLSWAGNRVQPDDNAIYKTLGLCLNWKLAYACDDIAFIFPIFEKARELLRPIGRPDSGGIRRIVREAYLHVLENDFFTKYIARYNYSDFADFRSRGQTDLGPVYFELLREYGKHSIGVELIIMGYDHQNQGRLFGIDHRGGDVDYNLTKTAVIGDGYWTALASLNRRPMNYFLHPTIYRLLEANFVLKTLQLGGPLRPFCSDETQFQRF